MAHRIQKVADTGGMSPAPTQRRFLPSSPFQAQPTPTAHVFAEGDRITHDRHGLGKVVRASEHRIDVDFGFAVIAISLPNAKVTPL
jgi:hypothetical protein